MMTMTRQTLVILAAGGSVALLAGAFLFQAMGYAPCPMCLWQRWPHGAAVVIGAAVLLGGPRVLIWLGALAAATTSGIGLYHAGVEQGWWKGPSSCTGTGLGGLSVDQLLSTSGQGLVMCDQIAWAFAGISMAGWNALLSAALCALWLLAARRA